MSTATKAKTDGRVFCQHPDPSKQGTSIDRDKFLAELYRGLKTDGVLGIVDHVAAAGTPRSSGGTVHRIDPALVIEDLQNAGFELVGESDVLRTAGDDYSKLVFDPAVRGKTDRFVLRFKKAGG